MISIFLITHGFNYVSIIFRFNICIPDLSANIKSKRKNIQAKDQVANRGRNIQFRV